MKREVYVVARVVHLHLPEKPFIARVATPFDDPDSRHGQWTVRLSEEGWVQAGLDSTFLLTRYRLEFLVDEPLSKVEKGMALELHWGLTHLASLVVSDVVDTPGVRTTMETAVVLDRDWRPIYFHTPPGRTGGSLPDSHDLWDVLWTNRERVLGVAHSHPCGGVPGPSYTDVTTFAAIEAALGKRLYWPIITVEAYRVFEWRGPERIDYAMLDVSLTVEMLGHWVPELLRLSQ